MTKLHQFRNSGFTVVELLIVITAIAILAVLSFIGYGEITKNAYNTQVIAGVVQYKDTIETYKGYYRMYPPTTKENNDDEITLACLGDGYVEDFCGEVSGIDTFEDSGFNAELAKIGKGGAISAEKLSVNTETFVGAVYGIDLVSGDKSPTNYARTIQYALKGKNADCKIDGAWKYALQENPPMTACEIILETVPSR